MTTWNVSRLGQSNGSGSNQALFDDVFVNLVRHTFETSTQFLGLTRKRMISKGRGATFPHIGRIGGKFHVPGVEVAANAINKAETYIPVDQLIVAPAVTANIDEWMSEIDYRNDYAMEIGGALGRTMDQHIAYAALLGARAASDLTERSGGATGGQTGASGGQVTDDLAAGDAGTSATSLFNLISNAVRIMDEKDVPKEDRFTILRPLHYHMLLKAGHITMDRDFGGVGSAAGATLPAVWGTKLIVSNQFPTSATGGPSAGTAGTTDGNDALDSGTETGGNDYSGDFADSIALVGQRQAMGTVVLKDVDMESEYSVARQATLMMGRYAVGHKVIRPECLCEITSRTP
jgi:hypothetical protein